VIFFFNICFCCGGWLIRALCVKKSHQDQNKSFFMLIQSLGLSDLVKNIKCIFWNISFRPIIKRLLVYITIYFLVHNFILILFAVNSGLFFFAVGWWHLNLVDSECAHYIPDLRRRERLDLIKQVSVRRVKWDVYSLFLLVIYLD